MKQRLQSFQNRWRVSVWRHRDLRIVGPARALSVLGDELALIALLLRVHDTGGGPAGVTLLLMSAAVPTVLLAPWAGRLADRYDSRRLATASASAQLGVCVALAFSTSPWLVYPLVIALQAGQAVANPTWGALIPKVVGEADIARAQGGMSALLTVGAVAGPAAGGLLTGLGGTRLPLLADAATFAVLAGAGLAVRTRRGGRWSPPADGHARGPHALDGLRLLSRDTILRPVFAALMAYIVVGEATNVVEVFLVRDALHGTATQYGLVGTAASIGIVAGSLLGGRDASLPQRLRWVVLAAAGQALMICLAGLAPSVVALAAAWSLLGVANGILNTNTSTLLITRTPEASRGQVIAAAMGASRAFSLTALALGGLAGATLGPRTTFIAAGAGALAVTAALAWAVRWAWNLGAGAPTTTVPATAAPHH